MLLIFICILKGHFRPLNGTQIYTFDYKNSILSVSTTSGFFLLGALNFRVKNKKMNQTEWICLVALPAWFSNLVSGKATSAWPGNSSEMPVFWDPLNQKYWGQSPRTSPLGNSDTRWGARTTAAGQHVPRSLTIKTQMASSCPRAWTINTSLWMS